MIQEDMAEEEGRPGHDRSGFVIDENTKLPPFEGVQR